jgi:hypothetical protein
MRIAARFVIAFVAAVVLFFVGVFATFAINRAIYGPQAFDGDAGAKFGVLMEGLSVGAVLGVVGLAVGAYLSFRILPDSTEPRSSESV